jgi:vesicle transport protein SEC22
MVKSGIIYLTLADKKYPQKLAFLYLNEVQEAFQSELKNTYGSGNVDFLSKIEAIDN